MIYIGDKVKVIDYGWIYCNYRYIFEKFNFKNKDYNDAESRSKTRVYEVVKKGKHHLTGITILGLKRDDKKFAIGQKGVILYQRSYWAKNIKPL